MAQDRRQPARFEYVARGVRRLAVGPCAATNVYLIDDILVDAGSRRTVPRILQALEGHALRGHVVTHVHPDHQGGTHQICTTLGIPLWCGAADREAMETGDLTSCYPRPDAYTARLPTRLWGGPAHPVARGLVDGDTVGDFEVLETPGHTAGHIALWRRADGVLIAGDVMFGLSPFTLRRKLREPPTLFTVNPGQNRESIRRLAALEPRVLCCGHGLPVFGRHLLRAFAARLAGPQEATAPVAELVTPERAWPVEAAMPAGNRTPAPSADGPVEPAGEPPVEVGD